MNIIFLSSESAHHYYLINEIHKHHSVKKVFFQTTHTVRKNQVERIKWIGNPKNYGRVLRALLDRLVFGRERMLADKFEKEFLFYGVTPALDTAIPYEIIKSFNDEKIASIISVVKVDNPKKMLEMINKHL